ncbi:hypothetical protein ABEB36_011503 [Hypothenemus hampei]|uniref:Mid2 domain-containing protein n=1 Tax=Hypothenemus hampei TaxID=57062 RepID=A0ABD1EFN2_HYPHA
MTFYWWMHWFWITSICFYRQPVVAFTQAFMTTLHSIPTTTNQPVTKLVNVLDSENPVPIPPNVTSPVILRNISQYARNVSIPSPPQFSRKIDMLPLDSNESSTDWVNGTNVPVINENSTENGNYTGFISNRSTNVSNSDNVTYFGDELTYNKSFIPSKQTGFKEEDLKSVTDTGNLSAAGITGITLGCIVIVGVICGVSFFLYRNQGFNKPQVLNDRWSNPDSSGYIDDTSDNSEEMYSLDNDSFLNSLEAMTIQNYWTDTVKHTKL